MRSISLTQLDLFDYWPNEEPGDLQRLNVVLREIPYKPLLRQLNLERGNGRDDYPNQTMFFILIAQLLYERLDPAAMRRELAMNPSLRWLVGLSDAQARCREKDLVPAPRVFTLFLDRLIQHQDYLDRMYDELRRRLYRELPDFGVLAAGDGKYFDSFTPNRHSGEPSSDKRAEHDAAYSTKQYVFYTDAGERHTKKETHFGFRKHTLVDAKYEIPIATALTPANEDEKKVMTNLFGRLPTCVTRRMQYCSFDRGYDSVDFIRMVRNYDIKPIIDKRRMRKGDPLLQYKDTIIYYSESSEVFYLDFHEERRGTNPDTNQPYCMKRARYLGYDKEREALRYDCGGRTMRIYIEDEPRIFNEVARDSQKFKRLYDTRTAVERYHSRLDCDMGFETHTIRGLQKMKVITTMADIVMMAVALAHISKGQTNLASIFDFDFF